MNLEGIEPIIQVLSKLTIPDRNFEIAVRGGDDANIGPNRLVAPHTREAKILEDVEELCLKGSRHLSDLVQTQRSPARELEPTRLSAEGSRERSLFVAEQLRLEELGRKRRAIDQHEWTNAPSRGCMNCPRNKILSTPLSPRTSTVASVRATSRTTSLRARIRGLQSNIARGSVSSASGSRSSTGGREVPEITPGRELEEERFLFIADLPSAAGPSFALAKSRFFE